VNVINATWIIWNKDNHNTLSTEKYYIKFNDTNKLIAIFTQYCPQWEIRDRYLWNELKIMPYVWCYTQKHELDIIHEEGDNVHVEPL